MVTSTGVFSLPPRLAGVLAAVPDFGLGFLFLLTWFFPFAFGEKTLSYLMLVMVLEFIILHSSVFAGVMMFSGMARTKKSVALIAIGLFYTVFVAGFSLAFGVWWPFFAFWGLMVNRLLGVLLGQATTGNERLHLIKSWIVGMMAYLVGAALTSVIPLPALGIDAAVIAAQELDAGGSWVEEPQSLLAFGFFYFIVTAVSGMNEHSWLKLPAGLADKIRVIRSHLDFKDPV